MCKLMLFCKDFLSDCFDSSVDGAENQFKSIIVFFIYSLKWVVCLSTFIIGYIPETFLLYLMWCILREKKLWRWSRRLTYCSFVKWNPFRIYLYKPSLLILSMYQICVCKRVNENINCIRSYFHAIYLLAVCA